MTIVGRSRWPGRWLWPPRPPLEPGGLFHERAAPANPDQNTFTRFRAVFRLDRAPRVATLWLSADGRYLASLDGQRLGRGPAASDADVREIDPYDLSGRLAPGEHVLAVLVHAYGVDTAWYTRPGSPWLAARGAGALYAHLDLGGTVRLAHPGAWRCQRAADWQPDTPRVNESLGFVEVRDLRREPVGWELPGFDDSAWERPEVCAPPRPQLQGPTYFPLLRPRALPHLRETAVRPAADAGERSRLLLDFGRLVAGRPRVDVEGADGAVLDLATAEQIDGRGELVVDLFGSRHGHRFVLRDGPQTVEQWDWVGFRYLALTVREAPRPVAIRSVAALSFEDPSPCRGTFACSDETLSAAWQTGVNTLRLAIKDVFASDVAREQRQWVGDLQAALGPVLRTFGAHPLLAQALRQVGEAAPLAGFLPMYAPGDYRQAGTTIPDFTLRWLLALDEYLAWTDDRALAHDLYPAVQRAVRAFEPFLEPSGLLGDVPCWHFVDWAAVGRQPPAGPLNGLYLLALRAAARLAATVGHPREARALRQRAEAVRTVFRATFFSPDTALAGDAAGGRPPYSQHTNALALLAGAAPGRARRRIAAAIGDPSRLRVTAWGRIVPPEDADPDYHPARHVILAQPGFMGFVLRALAAAGRADLALQLVRDRWGPMATGQTGTSWETWSGRHSRCHPWGVAPVAELSRIVLGVGNGLAPGGRSVAIRPEPGGLTWARGTVPLPAGDLRLSWTREHGALALAVDVPPGATARLPTGEILPAGTHARRLPARP